MKPVPYEHDMYVVDQYLSDMVSFFSESSKAMELLVSSYTSAVQMIALQGLAEGMTHRSAKNFSAAADKLREVTAAVCEAIVSDISDYKSRLARLDDVDKDLY